MRQGFPNRNQGSPGAPRSGASLRSTRRIQRLVALAGLLAFAGCASHDELQPTSTAQRKGTVCEKVTIGLVHVLRLPFYPILLMAQHDLSELTPLETASE
jgi:hypothetical protein